VTANVDASSVVDPAAIVGAGTTIWHFCHVMRGARIGSGCSLGQGCFVGPDVAIGDRVRMQNNVSVFEGVSIEDDVFLGPGAVFTNVRNPRAGVSRKHAFEKTRVQRGATVGANATIVAGVTLGRYCFVAAGAVVTRDVPDFTLVAGVPARSLGWMSRQGERLVFDGEGRASCPATGEEYRLEADQVRLVGAVLEAPSGEAPGARESGSADDAPCSSGAPRREAAASGEHGSVPLFDARSQNAPLLGELAEALERVLRSGRFVMGSELEAFEHDVAAYLGVEHAAGMSSGSDALVAALLALGVGPGDEVVTTPFSFVATAEAVARVGATPRFADIDAVTLQLSPSSVRAALTPRTRALIAVHLYGDVAPVAGLESALEGSEVVVVEDAAQAFGAAFPDGTKAGTLARLGCYSFFPSKPLGAIGDAGLAVTRDAGLAERLRQARVHGAAARYEHAFVAGNFRLDEVQAAALRVKLRHVDAWQERRARIARRYDEALAGVPGLVLPERAAGSAPSFALYTVRVAPDERARFVEHLNRFGIGTAIHYPRPLHLQPAFAHLGYAAGDFPVAERAAASVVSLPIHAELRHVEVERVVAAVRAFFETRVG
jgi:dTDP-4-amino-4,6-dideoxygalactose transaminase/acetyltransferase-like isoleucine patch superfamily enzyme